MITISTVCFSNKQSELFHLCFLRSSSAKSFTFKWRNCCREYWGTVTSSGYCWLCTDI